MAAPTNTGELRIDSAQRVLTEVISAIPETDAVNVGLRVYGHRGDNTDEGRPESCVSSELLVPMQGVNKPELLAQVDALQPVGWTPLGYALDQAQADFTQPASDDVVNAIVMVTDGLETCGADPVTIAGQLRNSDAGITTHVIGFGTTPEEQAILSGIAQAGGGQLLGSDNTGQLMSALFEILEELDVVEETGTGESRNSPLGVGRIGTVGDYEISVISVTPNANEIVAAENQFNEPPLPGNQFFVARIAATYVGGTSGNPAFELDYQTVGASSSSYTTYTHSCGVVPSDFSSVTEQFTGGSVEFNLCWEIESTDADSLVMYVTPIIDFSASPTWFSVGNPIEMTIDSDQDVATSIPVAPTPTPMPQLVTTATAATGSATNSSRENPVPIGQSAKVGDYEVAVASVVPFANDAIAAENQFNEPPSPGNQFFIATISATYVGSTAGNPAFELDYNAVGANNSSYATYANYCGVVPDDSTMVTEQFPGGTVEFNVCWQIDSTDESSLVMYVESFLDFDVEPVWFSVQP
ncbi:MAG: VWA domain-containing protein [Chloroflexota bacterium]|nr:VWA domain-containing protein [Chloroflexota bacterium]